MVKRMALDRESGLLRWAFSRDFNALLQGFQNRFQGIFELDKLRPWADGMVADSTYEIAFHCNMKSHVSNNARTFDLSGAELKTVYEADKAIILGLRDRFLRQLSSGSHVFVYKRNVHSMDIEAIRESKNEDIAGNKFQNRSPSFSEMQELIRVLKSFNNNNKLLAISVSTDKEPGTVWEHRKDLYFASLDKNAPYRAASLASYGCWHEIISNASNLIFSDRAA